MINITDDYDFTSAEAKSLYMVGKMQWDSYMLRFKDVIWPKLLGVF